jgi:hypothetical protein
LRDLIGLQSSGLSAYLDGLLVRSGSKLYGNLRLVSNVEMDLRINPGSKALGPDFDAVVADEQFLEREFTTAVGSLYVLLSCTYRRDHDLGARHNSPGRFGDDASQRCGCALSQGWVSKQRAKRCDAKEERNTPHEEPRS